MTDSSIIFPLIGGGLIGLSASLLYAFNGRIAGISGILSRLIGGGSDRAWRLVFLAGMLTGGIIFLYITPEQLVIDIERSPTSFVLAGIFVGFGTALANGCTSGHGVCGISRTSRRSIYATLVFMGTGIFSVWLVRVFWGGTL